MRESTVRIRPGAPWPGYRVCRMIRPMTSCVGGSANVAYLAMSSALGGPSLAPLRIEVGDSTQRRRRLFLFTFVPYPRPHGEPS